MLKAKDIKEYAVSCGFTACGITAAGDFPEYSKALDDIVRTFPETGHLYRPMYRRAHLQKNFPWAKSIVVCIRNYGKYKLPAGIIGHIGRNYLCDSRVPENPDYFMIKRFTAFLKDAGMKVRKGGVPDRLAAAKAGVAQIGRNNFAYAESCGSWLNIATYIVDAELDYDKPSLGSPCPDGCDLCIGACPTGALSSPYMMRMDYCIAFLTYGAPLPINPGLAANMGRWIYGCDACQDACPLNRDKWQEKEELPHLNKISELLVPEALSSMDIDTYKNIVYPMFQYISADNIERWHNNAKRALKRQIS